MSRQNKRLVILSDMWGTQLLDELDLDLSSSEAYSQVQFYNSRVLAGIDEALSEESVIHQQFLSGGIERAVTAFHKLESDPFDVLAFSIGGTIAWKAALEGMKINRLIAASATRLRMETRKPAIGIQLIYGGLDQSAPDDSWFSKMEITPLIVENQGHDWYRDQIIAAAMLKVIIARN